MTLFRTYSKLKIARIFSVNRLTIYNWESRGCPTRAPERPGRPAKMIFEDVLQWYLAQEEIKGVSEEGLQILEAAIRKRKNEHDG